MKERVGIEPTPPQIKSPFQESKMLEILAILRRSFAERVIPKRVDAPQTPPRRCDGTGGIQRVIIDAAVKIAWSSGSVGITSRAATSSALIAGPGPPSWAARAGHMVSVRPLRNALGSDPDGDESSRQVAALY